jgi:hypothetical protein
MIRSSASIFALHVGLGLGVIAVAGCREVKGQCGKRTDTVCLQIDLADRSVIPDIVSLQLSANEVTRTSGLPNAAATLRDRPYIVELELTNPPPVLLTIRAEGTSLTSGVGEARQPLLLTAQLTLQPSTAARPTILILTGPGGSGEDMAAPQDGPTGQDGYTSPDQRPTQWQQVYSSPMPRLRAMSGTTVGALTIWGVGDNGLIVRGDGNTFSAVTPPALGAPLTGLWAVSSTTLYVCDSMGRVFFTTNAGSSWTGAAVGSALRAIYGRGPNDIMVVGDNSTTGHHFDGTSWNAVTHNLGAPATSVWFGSMYWYVVGNDGHGARAMDPETASSWTTLTPLSAKNLQMISGQAGSDQFPLAVGDDGVVQYYHPAGMWMSTGYPGGAINLTSAWVTGTGFAHVAGANGTVWRYTNGPWQSLGNANLASYTLTGIWGDGTGGLWVSGHGLASDPGGIWKY